MATVNIEEQHRRIGDLFRWITGGTPFPKPPVRLQELVNSDAATRQYLQLQRDRLNYDQQVRVHFPELEVCNREQFPDVYQRFVGYHIPSRVRQKENFGVVIGDLDNFKHGINERYGYDAGDYIVASALNAIRTRLSGGDILARKGGDEWVALIHNVPSGKHDILTKIATRFVESVSDLEILIPEHVQTIGHSDGHVKVTTSVGVASAEDSDNPYSVLALANKALKAAKENGGNQVARYRAFSAK